MVLFHGEQYFHNNPSVLTDKLYLSAARVISSRLLIDLGITCVINATLELPTMAYNTTDCLQIAVEDRVASKLYIYFDLVADKINSVHAQPNGRLLIYCRAGMSRSASLCIAYFIKYHGMTLDDAFAYVKERRPIIHPNIGFLRQLRDYEKKLKAIRTGVECPLSYQTRCDVILPPLTYATQDSFEDPVEDYDVQTKVIKPKPKPRKPKINLTEVMELCAETYQTTSLQICSEYELDKPTSSASSIVNEPPDMSLKGMTEPTGTVASISGPDILDTLDPEELSSFLPQRRVPFTKLSEPGKIAVSYLQLQLDHFKIPSGGGCLDLDLFNNPMHAFSVFTELRVFLANSQTITLECVGDYVPQNLNFCSNVAPQLASVCDWFLLETPPIATSSFVLDVHWGIQYHINEICHSLENFKKVDMSQLGHLLPRPSQVLSCNQEMCSFKRTKKTRSSIKLAGLKLSPILQMAQAKLISEKIDVNKLICPSTEHRTIFKTHVDSEFSYNPTSQRLAFDIQVKKHQTCHWVQTQTLEALSEDQGCSSSSTELVFAITTLVSQHELKLVERYAWDDIEWMSVNEIMPCLEYPIYECITSGDAERILLKALEEPSVEEAWCFAINPRISSTSICYVVQKNVIKSLNERQNNLTQQIHWANDDYHVDLSFTHHETFPFEAVESGVAVPSVDASFEYLKRAIVVSDMNEEPLQSLTILKKVQFQKYDPWFITNICIHPMIQVSEQSLQLLLEMNDFYCEPTTFGVKPIRGLWTSLACHAVSNSIPDVRHELLELMCIPDVVGDIQTLKRMILCQSDSVKIGIWLEVFERSIISTRPIYPFIRYVDTLPVAISSEVTTQGWSHCDSDGRPLRRFYCAIQLEMQYQTQTCRECVPLENTEDIFYECEDSNAEEAIFSDLSFTLAQGTSYDVEELLLWDDCLLLEETYCKDSLSFVAQETFEPLKEYAIKNEAIIYEECEPLRTIAVSWRERKVFTKLTSSLFVSIIEICEHLHEALEMPRFEFVQDLEDFADWEVESDFVSHQCEQTGPLDTFWFFDMSKVPSNQRECPVPTTLKLFLPDPEMVDRLGKQQCLSSESVGDGESDEVPISFDGNWSSRFKPQNSFQKRVSFQENMQPCRLSNGAFSSSSNNHQRRQMSSRESRSISTRGRTISSANLVSFQRPRSLSRNKTKGLSLHPAMPPSAAAVKDCALVEDKRVMANLETSVRQSSDLLLQLNAVEKISPFYPCSSDQTQASNSGRCSTRRGKHSADALNKGTHGSSSIADLTLRSLLESAQNWVRNSSSRSSRRDRSRSKCRR